MRNLTLLSSLADRARKRTASFLVALLALGCVEPLSPSEVAGRYELQRVQNAPLPFVYPGPSNQTQRLLSGHLILFADGSAEQVMNIETPNGTGATRVVVQRTSFVYELDGRRLTLWIPRTPCQAIACTLLSSAKRQLRFLGDALVETDGLYYVRSEITTQ